jgi:two-component sensor histidine kinase
MAGRDELSSVGASLDRLLDELECRRRRNDEAEEERALLVRELAHRVKNGFALVQAIARQTLSRVDPERYIAFADRLTALAGAYDLILTRDATVAAPIRDVIGNALRAHMDAGSQRVRLEGPEIALPADMTLPLSLVIHELATNATKYGSLGSDDGVLIVSWEAEGPDVRLSWREQGGPPVRVPTTKGFGSTLIERAFPARSSATCAFDFRPTGLVFDLHFSIVG